MPEAYQILTDPMPPVLAKVQSNVTSDEAVRIGATVLTDGEERFNKAQALARAGKTAEAIAAFEALCKECRTSWIDRLAHAIETLVALADKDGEKSSKDTAELPPSIPAMPESRKTRMVFAENFEEPSLEAIQKRWETVTQPEIMSLADDVPAASGGKHSLLMANIGGKGTGGHLYRRLQPGYEKLYGRFYVKFDPDSRPHPSLWYDTWRNSPGNAMAQRPRRRAAGRRQVVLGRHRTVRKKLGVGLLHLLVRDARQPASRANLGQQLRARSEAQSRGAASGAASS